MTDALPLARTLVVAPHPDDEVVAAGGLIQRAFARGGRVLVLCLTGGEENPWPQRAALKRWRITAADREAWAETRRLETIDGLARIGGLECTHFLDYPDQGLSELVRRGDDRLTRDIGRALDELAPTLVVSPSSFDVHRDHRAAAWFVHRAVAQSVPIVTYTVHSSAPGDRIASVIRLDEAERIGKQNAIACHKSQLLLSRKRFMTYSRRDEVFYRAEYDVVKVESRLGEALADLRHMMHVLRG